MASRVGGQDLSRLKAKRSAKKARGRFNGRSAAFEWLAYKSRSTSLRLLRVNRIHVDTTICTRDGYSDQVHWQVISALCPRLIERSRIKYDRQQQQAASTKLCYTIVFPSQISGPMARLLVECAYGMEHISIDRTNLDTFYAICCKFDIAHGINVCLNYATSQLDVHNCVYLFRLSLKHRHHRLRRSSYAMIRSNFKLVLHANPDIHKLDLIDLKRLLEDDSLRVNEDEELAWLAIIRWLTKKPLTTEQLANLYNQMVAGPQEVHINLFQSNNNALQTRQQQQQAARNNRFSLGDQSVPPIRVLLNFYSPGNPAESSNNTGGLSTSNRLQQAAKSTTEGTHTCSPLRLAADKISSKSLAHAPRLSQHQPSSSSSRRPPLSEEEQLYSLLKCLRFMRFKSPNSFDVILACPSVNGSERLTALVNYMRVRYKLRHKLELTSDEKQSMDRAELSRLKYEEASKRQRLVRFMTKFVRVPAAAAQLPNHCTAAAPTSGAIAPDDGASGRKQGPSGYPEAPITVDGKQQQQEQRLDAAKPGISGQLLGAKSLSRANRPRVPNSIGLLIGGWQDGAISKTMWAYDFIYDKWFKLNIKLPESRALHASCSSPVSGHVYIFGGTNGVDILNSVWRFNPYSDVFHAPVKKLKDKFTNVAHEQRRADLTSSSAFTSSLPKINTITRGANPFGKPARATSGGGKQRLVYKFKQLRPMNERRCHLAGVFHSDGRLYALGGHNGQQRLRSAEWYDTKCNQWHSIADMTIARSDAAACSHDNKIYIAGGQISDQFIQSSVEFYKSSDNTWTFAAPMIIPRMSFNLASYKGHLLALGGTNGLLGGDEVASITRSVERYNSQSGSWSFCAPMVQKRCSFATMLIENKLIVVGGHSGRRRLKSCESLRIGQFNAFINSNVIRRRGSSSDSPQRDLIRVSPIDDSRRIVASAFGGGGPLQVGTPNRQGQAVSAGAALPQTGQTSGSRLTDDLTTTLAHASSNLRQLAAATNNQAYTANTLVNLRLMAQSGAARLGQLSMRSSMKWVKKAELPERRSGFSIAVVHQLNNAKDYTYFGSLKPNEHAKKSDRQQQQGDNNGCPSRWRPSLIRQPGRWHKFKIIKRRKLVKHLKIALVVTIVILMM